MRKVLLGIPVNTAGNFHSASFLCEALHVCRWQVSFESRWRSKGWCHGWIPAGYSWGSLSVHIILYLFQHQCIAFRKWKWNLVASNRTSSTNETDRETTNICWDYWPFDFPSPSISIAAVRHLCDSKQRSPFARCPPSSKSATMDLKQRLKALACWQALISPPLDYQSWTHGPATPLAASYVSSLTLSDETNVRELVSI